MPRQNRVTPFGSLEAVTARGTLMGNRGILHDPNGALRRARWQHRRWIACRLEFKSRRRKIMSPRSYTELFFLDEAVAFAAGHRPCAECRREEYLQFRTAWIRAKGVTAESPPSIDDIDRDLHAARVQARSQKQVTWQADLPTLPDGTFVCLGDGDEDAWVVCRSDLLHWTHFGYDRVRSLRDVEVEVLTPAPIVDVFRVGYRPTLHATADTLRGSAVPLHRKGDI
jgi:hypothetical protein